MNKTKITGLSQCLRCEIFHLPSDPFPVLCSRALTCMDHTCLPVGRFRQWGAREGSQSGGGGGKLCPRFSFCQWPPLQSWLWSAHSGAISPAHVIN